MSAEETPPMLTLRRFAHDPVQGTIGELYLGRQTLFTLEDPWRHNERNRSCIPEGEYHINRDHRGKHRVYRVQNVTGRSDIEFHSGVDANATEGCILLGTNYVLEPGNWRLTDSPDAVARFLNFMEDRSARLWVRNLI
jgi:hypothetical protein